MSHGQRDVVCDYHGTLISVAEGHRRGDSIYRFFFKELCIDASSRCDCHPEVETTTPPPVVTATLKWRHMTLPESLQEASQPKGQKV
ncbi:hypothetical protein KUCAC02_029520 [Chaenocephalus aceratus]|nr:hypothetical protein KUCAC02_029520 [Chaenocephalus aceratus]